jgi:hypothetical protein
MSRKEIRICGVPHEFRSDDVGNMTINLKYASGTNFND